MGNPDPAFYVGDITWLPVVKEFYWEVELDDVLVGGESLRLCQHDRDDGKCRAVFDTGTSLLAAPPEDVSVLLSHIGINPSCDNFDALPTITYVFGGARFDLEPQHYIRRNDISGYCKSSFMPLDVPPPKGPLWVMGDVFFRKFYITFDRENSRVGVGKNLILFVSPFFLDKNEGR